MCSGVCTIKFFLCTRLHRKTLNCPYLSAHAMNVCGLTKKTQCGNNRCMLTINTSIYLVSVLKFLPYIYVTPKPVCTIKFFLCTRLHRKTLNCPYLSAHAMNVCGLTKKTQCGNNRCMLTINTSIYLVSVLKFLPYIYVTPEPFCQAFLCYACTCGIMLQLLLMSLIPSCHNFITAVVS